MIPCMPEEGEGMTVIQYDPAVELCDDDLTVGALKHRLVLALCTVDACYAAAEKAREDSAPV